MKRDEIMKLEDEELGVLVAEKVMGAIRDVSNKPTRSGIWIHGDEAFQHNAHWRPYESIYDAWEVLLEKNLSIIQLSNNKWFCGFWDDDQEYFDTEMGCIDGHFGGGYNGMNGIFCVADTAPLAICRTALLFAMVKK